MAQHRYERATGLIPARAGTTTRSGQQPVSVRAHPRSRGDHLQGAGRESTTLGSSPLARGPPALFRGATARFGLIPARAGTTFWLSWLLFRFWAHPRSRGDHYQFVTTPPYQFGLIPARAGTTFWRASSGLLRGAHPRSRGDHRGRALKSVTHWGSSPLARGPLASAVDIEPRAGLIPARAGTTSGKASLAPTDRAHPRSRGDHPPVNVSTMTSLGSSPLARGPPC